MLYKLIKKCKSRFQVHNIYIYISSIEILLTIKLESILNITYYLLIFSDQLFIYPNKISLCEREIIDLNKN